MTNISVGSTLHYSLLWTEPAARQRFIERLELVHALGTTLEAVHEPQVAERKIHWWHEELQRMSEGSARHPAAQACQSSLVLSNNPSWPADQNNEADQTAIDAHPALNACLNIVSAASTMRFTPPSSEKEANALLEKNYLARMALLAHALSDNIDDLDLPGHSSLAALALGKFEQLSRLPHLIHRGQAVFSDQLYKQHAIRPTDLAGKIRIAPDAESPSTKQASSGLHSIPLTVEKPEIQALLNAAITTAHQDFQRAMADDETVSRYRQAPLLPLWRLIVLREKQLAMWQRNPPNLLRERTTLTPLVKLFHAWRNRR
ncbi:hypothetical protein [Granulosicoccus antarcticus]|uniref:Uncharacterized protein n=1 Tax=Granulosicoccus antarcticus IMCC3135 TaxID=1192854 RepID=A0A2Z2NUP9_9GAMM|nr:hypothetical protein [Granulosicoccus antarcticus]ASJ75226.1 hypothetical protein IMCC3135_25855 [Granulosicoccus antarcticus IMCC3135]